MPPGQTLRDPEGRSRGQSGPSARTPDRALRFYGFSTRADEPEATGAGASPRVSAGRLILHKLQDGFSLHSNPFLDSVTSGTSCAT